MDANKTIWHIDFLEEIRTSGDRLGLESVQNLFLQLNSIQEHLPVVSVVGTNGKGSVCCFLDSILKEAGYKVGYFSSPQVFSYANRYMVDGEPITPEAFAEALEPVKDAYRRLQQERRLLPTLFEAETAVAVCHFVNQRCDLAIMEAGMGGDLDATNVFAHPLLAVFTPIGFDHMQFLGDTLEEIAHHKAGILKYGERAVSAWQDKRVGIILKQAAKKLDAHLSFADQSRLSVSSVDPVSFSYEDYQNIRLRMCGAFQACNAATAILAARALVEQGYVISRSHIYEGLSKAFWPGRMERLSCEGMVYLDGAHNALAATALVNTIQQMFAGKKITMILGMLKDKDFKEVLSILVPHASHVIAVTPPSERALPKEILAKTAEVFLERDSVICAKTASEAVKMSRHLQDDVILVTGTLTILADFREAF